MNIKTCEISILETHSPRNDVIILYSPLEEVFCRGRCIRDVAGVVYYAGLDLNLPNMIDVIFQMIDCGRKIMSDNFLHADGVLMLEFAIDKPHSWGYSSAYIASYSDALT